MEMMAASSQNSLSSCHYLLTEVRFYEHLSGHLVVVARVVLKTPADDDAINAQKRGKQALTKHLGLFPTNICCYPRHYYRVIIIRILSLG